MASAWEPLKNNIFRNLFIAQLVSNVGLWMQSVGAQWFLVDNHAGPTVISLVQTASLAPTLVLSLLAGVLADLLDRKWLLVVTSVYEFPAQGAGDGRQRKHHDTRRGDHQAYRCDDQCPPCADRRPYRSPQERSDALRPHEDEQIHRHTACTHPLRQRQLSARVQSRERRDPGHPREQEQHQGRPQRQHRRSQCAQREQQRGSQYQR